MKTRTHPAPSDPRGGFILFFAMGLVALLSMAALIATTSARLESRTASNHLASTRALYHAEAGIKLVKRNVENRLSNGEALADILDDLSVTAPEGFEFDEINSFRVIVPDRIFSFESVGRSGEAEVSVVVQFRRRPVMMAGLFGSDSLTTRPNMTIYGYDSRVVLDPSPSDSNGGASVGSNGSINLGNHLLLDGSILLGETAGGLLAGCSGCSNFVQLQVGHVDPDPLGLTTGGTMSSAFNNAMTTNNNSAFPAVISNNTINTAGEITLTAGDYYLTDVYLKPKSKLILDDTNGPIRIFLNGPWTMQPNSDLVVTSGRPYGFQLYSTSTEDITLRPNGDSESFLYAPKAKIFILPNNDAKGAYWARVATIQPNGELYIDTSLQERMLMNNLEMHSWFEQHNN
jgi:hypothetical protein